MAKTAVKSSGARRGRPALKPGSPKRGSFNTRLRTEIKQQLEAEAQIAGRSLSEEIEFRLERSLQQEADSGGRRLHALFGLFGNAAVLIEEQTGKPYFKDWRTFVAVKAAMEGLMIAFGPQPPKERDAAFEVVSKAELPILPTLPQPPGPLGDASSEEIQQYEKARKEYEAALPLYQKQLIKIERAGEALRGYIESDHYQEAFGEDIAVSLVSEIRKKKA